MVSIQTKRLTFLVAIFVFAALSTDVQAQIFVYPQRPNQTNVRYFDFEWHHIDIMVGPNADTSDADSLKQGKPLKSLRFDTPGRMTDSPSTTMPSYLNFNASTLGIAPISHAPTFAQDVPTSPAGTPPDDENQPPAPLLPAPGTHKPPSKTSGGVRMFFYERERHIAERAAAFIENSYDYLVKEFNHVPTKTLPYVLYNSYQEFLQTNLFPIQEGVLGVTSRKDLQLVLPYFGDHRLFQHVSTHEMVHQFTIQKVRDITDDEKLGGDPLDYFPLWFIEGIAEYYSHRGLDPETEMMARDLLLNPDPMRGYVMLDFFEDRPYSGLWTYKIGQVRTAFLEETYGVGTLQKVLEQSPKLLDNSDKNYAAIDFKTLLSQITKDNPRILSAKFEAWLKHRSYSTFLVSEQDSPDVIFLNELKGVVQTMATSPDGYLMLYRSIRPETGEVSLSVVDIRDVETVEQITTDGRPGFESLHPVSGRTFDISANNVVFFASSEGRDVLYLQPILHSATSATTNEAGKTTPAKISLETGKIVGYELKDHKLLAAENPSFSPDGQQIAFIGLNEDGQKDLYIFRALEDGKFLLTRVTDDEYAERGVSWGDNGIVYSSDATGHGFYNLFVYDLDNPNDSKRLTFEARDHFDARVLPDGRIYFSSFDSGRANLYEIVDGGLVRRTDIVTGLFDISPGPNGSLWALFHHRGRRQAVRIPESNLLAVHTLDKPTTQAAPLPLPRRSLDGSEAYNALAFRNWELSNIFGVMGASGSGLFGQVTLLSNDRLRNHAIYLDAMAYGSMENTVANLLYINQESRLIWGAGLFQDVLYRVEQPFDNVANFLSGERFYGARGTLRYPLNRFLYLQGDLALGAATEFLPGGTKDYLKHQRKRNLEDPLLPDQDYIGLWNDDSRGTHFQTSPSVSLGYNTIQYHPGTGPIAGNSVLVEHTLNLQPFNSVTHGHVRLDAEQYFPIYDRINFSLRGALGTTYGGELSRQFYLSSFDTLRGVQFGDTDFLLGHRFFFTKAEVRFPLNFLIRIPIVDLEGIAGADFGAVGDDMQRLWNRRAFSLVTGFNFGLGPIVFRLHFAKPLDIGAIKLPANGNWITNFSLGWRYW